MMKLLRLALVVASMIVQGASCEAESNQTLQRPNMDDLIQKLGPKSALSVLWAGHSLMEQTASSSWGEVDLMSVVARFAESRGLSHTATNHTLFGSPLSALWRGKPHGYDRDASEMVAKREDFIRNAGRYDTLVLTEVVPVAATHATEFTPYYVRLFACALWQANPEGRVYLYQTWVHFQGSHKSDDTLLPEGYDWRAEMTAERTHWDALAERASSPPVDAPHWLSKLGWHKRSDGGCADRRPIYLVPVGSALQSLAERLEAPVSGDHFVWPDSTPFRMIDMVANPIVEGASGSFGDPVGRRARDPSRLADDIHASLAGIYFSALVHFATLYRQTPAGLPYPDEIGEPLARTLACIAWQTVISDPRSGVLGEADC